jgi:HD superfamily phosphohydrolase
MAGTKRIRTILYRDQRFTSGELELLHTPAMQRLYDLHQLGLTDRVYVDASHSRLHHVLGVVEQADRLMQSIARNLRRGTDRPDLKFGPVDGPESISAARLSSYVEMRRPVARLMGLLHDLTHSPFGHTLEDEIQLIQSKHDSPDRQADVFYRLLCQFFAWIAIDNHTASDGVRTNLLDRPATPLRTADFDSADLDLRQYLDGVDLFDPPKDPAVVAVLANAAIGAGLRPSRFSHSMGPQELRAFLRDLHLAMSALLHLELLHKSESELKPVHIPSAEKYAFQKLLEAVICPPGASMSKIDLLDPHRDAFLLDVIGNTICADLLDYAKRDAMYCGLNLDYDADRIIEQFTLVSEHYHARRMPGSGSKDPFAGHALRPAISIFTHKLRVDVPGQLMGLLQARFHVYERALFHPTKCIAGAMLGCALQLLGLTSLPDHVRQLGDQVFLHQVSEAARLTRDLLREKLDSSGSLTEEVRDGLIHRLLSLPPTGTTALAKSLISDLAVSGASRRIADALRDLDAGVLILDRIVARRYFKPVFRLLPNAELGRARALNEKDKDTPPAKLVAEVFQDAKNRNEVERLVEEAAGLPRGTVAMHCPPYSGPTKIAAVLLMVRAEDGSESLCSLRDIGQVANGIFAKHQEAVLALEEMYRSTWRLVVSVAPPHHTQHEVLSAAVSKVLTEYLVATKRKFYPGLEVPNDTNMVRELKDSEAEMAAPESPTNLVGELNARDVAQIIVPMLAVAIPGVQSRLDRLPTDSEDDRGWEGEVKAFIQRASAPGATSNRIVTVPMSPLTVDEVWRAFENYKIAPKEKKKIRSQVIPDFVSRANKMPDRLDAIRAMVTQVAIPEVAGIFNQLHADHVQSKFNQILSQAKANAPGNL